MSSFNTNEFGPQVQRYHLNLGEDAQGSYPEQDYRHRFRFTLPSQFIGAVKRNIKLSKVLFNDYYGAVSQDVTLHGDFGYNTFSANQFLGVVNTAVDTVYAVSNNRTELTVWFRNMDTGEVMEQINTDPLRLDVIKTANTGVNTYIPLGARLYTFVIVLEMIFSD